MNSSGPYAAQCGGIAQPGGCPTAAPGAATPPAHVVQHSVHTDPQSLDSAKFPARGCKVVRGLLEQGLILCWPQPDVLCIGYGIYLARSAHDPGGVSPAACSHAAHRGGLCKGGRFAGSASCCNHRAPPRQPGSAGPHLQSSCNGECVHLAHPAQLLLGALHVRLYVRRQALPVGRELRTRSVGGAGFGIQAPMSGVIPSTEACCAWPEGAACWTAAPERVGKRPPVCSSACARGPGTPAQAAQRPAAPLQPPNPRNLHPDPRAVELTFWLGCRVQNAALQRLCLYCAAAPGGCLTFLRAAGLGVRERLSAAAPAKLAGHRGTRQKSLLRQSCLKAGYCGPTDTPGWTICCRQVLHTSPLIQARMQPV